MQLKFEDHVNIMEILATGSIFTESLNMSP